MANMKIGDLAGKYETSVAKGDPGFISNGSAWGDPGGDSYGAYQLESKLGTLQSYLRTPDKYTKALAGLKVNTLAFRAKWKQLAKDDPEGFKQSQFDYLCKKPGGYNNAIEWAGNHGWAINSFALQSAIFSTVNQSGGWRKGIFEKAGIVPSDSVREQLNKLYDARANYFKSLSSLTPKIKKAIVEQRTVLERADALKLI